MRRRGDGDAPVEPAVRVLIVDDDEHFLSWLTLLMRRLGLIVTTAVDGEHALATLRQQSFDLVVSDYEMPRMNGLDLIREIRDTPSLAHQYAVMLTSHEELEAKIAALTIGYDDFLTKSCTEVEVTAKVVAAQRLVSRNRLLSAAATEWQTIASRDELTGVAMRRTLTIEADRCLAEARTIGVALIDIDDFKPINDNYGHLTGDRILRDVGALFLQRTRVGELLARYGGDEFVLLAPDQTIDDITGAAERLTTEIAAMQWTVGASALCVTVTTGIAHSSLLTNPTFEQILEVADQDLYAKKYLKKHPLPEGSLYDYPDAPAVTPVHRQHRARH
jgi:diguanylate cyclase (GGDEF)-like protein